MLYKIHFVSMLCYYFMSYFHHFQIFDISTELFTAVVGLVKIILGNKKDDKLYRQHVALTKRTYINNCSDPVIGVICNDLTGYACKIVCEQYKLSKNPSPLPNMYEVNGSTCTCLMYKTMRLTCRHIFRYRRQSSMFHN